MAWSTPRTWVAGEIVTAANLNTYVSDNLTYIKDRLDGTAKQYIRTATNYTTTSTSLVDVDGTNLALTFTTDGGDVMVTFAGYISNGNNVDTTIGVDVDSTDYEIIVDQTNNGADKANVSFVYIFTGLSAASHTFKLRWKTSSGTATLVAGTTLFDVRETIGLIA